MTTRSEEIEWDILNELCKRTKTKKMKLETLRVMKGLCHQRELEKSEKH